MLGVNQGNYQCCDSDRGSIPEEFEGIVFVGGQGSPINFAIIENNEQRDQPPVVVVSSSSSSSSSNSGSSNPTMPSKQTNDVLAVEELVHEIRENLRLKAKPAHQPSRSSRPSPYHIPCRSWSEPVCGGTGEKRPIKSCKKPAETDTIEDPYEFLQTLLKSNNLVKEAVRRLQHGLSPKQQRYFYESDEESRSPIVVMCQLES